MKKTIILSIALIFLVAGCSLPLSKNSKNREQVLGIEEAKIKVVDFINNNLMQPGSTVSVKEITEENNLYKVVVNMSNGQEIISYLTKDGKKFFPQVMDITEIEEKNKDKQATQAPQPTTVPKTDKPKVELFVMSFCPYGVQAEKAMDPVVKLLGERADIDVRFIASIEGDDLNNVKSLHGAIEGIEDARQLCVAKNYEEVIFWKYVNNINEDCYPIYRKGDDVYKECWEKAARDAGVNINKINSCLDKEGVSLISAEDTAAKGYGVSGSPSLVINGVKANPSRTPEGYKAAICDSFNSSPEECGTVLESTGDAPASGGCN